MHHDSPFRTTSASCPRCRTPLDPGELGFCRRCRGVWVPESALYERVAGMQAATRRAELRMQWAHDPRPPLPCVACQAPMQTLALFAVPIDRCGAAHGIWFDHDELGRVLLASHAQRMPRPSPEATLASDATPYVVDTAVQTASELTVWSVVEGAVEIVGGLVGAMFEL